MYKFRLVERNNVALCYKIVEAQHSGSNSTENLEHSLNE